nr:hypothetical protein [Tanacetum cinerariifolium]
MSSASSAVTYTSVYTDSEPGRVFWGADEELSDGGSSRVIVYGYDGLPMLPVAPPSPDYIPGPEEPQTPPAPQGEDEHELMFIQPHDPDFVPESIYPEYIPLEDKHILLAEEQPLPPVVSPTAESSGYVVESDPEEDPEEYEEDETEDGPVGFLCLRFHSGYWFESRYLDAEEHKSLITSLTTQLGSCTVFLVSEHARINEKLACDYCVLSFSELRECLMTDQLAEFYFSIKRCHGGMRGVGVVVVSGIGRWRWWVRVAVRAMVRVVVEV